MYEVMNEFMNELMNDNLILRQVLGLKYGYKTKKLIFLRTLIQKLCKMVTHKAKHC